MPAFAQYIHLITPARRSGSLTTDEKLALVEQWKQSGISARQFAEEHGVKPSTFGAWVRGQFLGEYRKPKNAAGTENREEGMRLIGR